MYKVSSPSSEARILIPKDLAIPLSPNIPSGSENHFRKEWEPKVLPGSRCHHVCGLIRMGDPRNTKIIPNTLVEVASEEKMHTILVAGHVTQNTSVILHIPMPALHHISGIQPIH